MAWEMMVQEILDEAYVLFSLCNAACICPCGLEEGFRIDGCFEDTF